MQFTPGDRVDRYQLIEPLGEGGQGSVWKAVDALDPTRVVALKLAPILHAKPNQLERVRREARGLAKLDHPSLVKCHGLFEDFKLSVLGLVLDVVDGVNLADALEDPRLVPALRWTILEHLARALAHLHEHRIIHRDLKPENVVLSSRFWAAPNDPTSVKMVDFGIAIEEGDPTRLTAHGNVIGTPAYMAPELIDATRFKGAPLTPAIDVFAFGVVAWRLLIGGHPTGLPPESTLLDYAVEYRRVTLGHRTWTTPAAGLPDVVTACIETDPQRRLQTGAQIVAMLTGVRSQPTRPILPSAPSQPRTEEARPPTGFYQNPRVSTRTATVVEPRAVHRSSRSPFKFLVSGVFLGGFITLGVLTLAIVGWLILGQGNPLGSTVATGQTTEAPPRRAAPKPTEESEEPHPRLAPSEWWKGALRPCPSGRGCEGDCRADIPSDELLRVRVAGAAEFIPNEKQPVALNKNHSAARVCFQLADLSTTERCTGLTEITGAAAASQYLDITAGQLRDVGLQVNVYEGTRTVARATKLSQSYERIALCVGAVFAKKESFAGTITMAQVSFFLDDPQQPTPVRKVRP